MSSRAREKGGCRSSFQVRRDGCMRRCPCALVAIAVGLLFCFAFVGEAAEPEVLWTLTSISSVTSAAVSDGTVYVGGDYTTLFEVSLDDGAVLAEHLVGTVGANPPSVASDGTIVCTTLDGKLLVLDPRTGEARTLDLESPIRTSAAVDFDGTVYVGADNGCLYAIDPGSAGILWSFDAGAPIRSSPVIHPDGHVLFGDDDGVFFALTPSGRLAWATELDGAVRYPAAVGPTETIYVGTTRGWLYALGASGDVLWEAKAGSLGIYSPVIGVWSDVYTTSLDGVLSGFSWDGRRLWSAPEASRSEHAEAMRAGSDWFVGSPCLSGSDVIYALTRSGVVEAYDVSGELLWEFDLAAEAGWMPLLAGSASDDDGAIDLGSSFGTPELALADGGVLLVAAGGQLTAISVDAYGPPFGGWPMFQRSASRVGVLDPWAVMAAAVPLSAKQPQLTTAVPDSWQPTTPMPTSLPESAVGATSVPAAGFATDAVWIDRTAPVRFRSTTIAPAGGRIVDMQWIVDGEVQSGGETLEVLFSELGEHTVTLIATDDLGQTDEYTEHLSVVNLSPTALLEIEPAEPAAGEMVRLSAGGSVDVDGGIVGFEWAFEDDVSIENTSEAVFQLAFADPGTYEVTVRVIDNDGGQSAAVREIHVASPDSGTPETEGGRYALVVGVSDYESWPDLAYGEADALAFLDFIEDPDRGGFPEESCRDLIGTNATQRNIKREIKWLLGEAGEGDLVILYFAGHGDQEKDFEGEEEDGQDEYLIPIDGTQDLFSTAIGDDDLCRWLSTLEGNGARTVLILDSCKSGGASRGEGSRIGMGDALVDISADTEQRVTLCASEEFESSYESDDLQHGVFTYFLLQGLGADETAPPRADTSGEGRVSIAELAAYLSAAVPTYVEETLGGGRSQHPVVIGDDKLIGEIWLSNPAAPVTGEIYMVREDLTRVLIQVDSAKKVEESDRFEVLRYVYDPDSRSVVAQIIAIVAVRGAVDDDLVLVSVEEHLMSEVAIVEGLPIRAMVRGEAS